MEITPTLYFSLQCVTAGSWKRTTEMFIFELASLWRGVLLCGDEALHGVRPSVFSASSEHSYQRDAVGRGSSRSPSLQPN